ncbi:MAG: DNA-processing protein DprA [Bacillota bacterium]|nr:DNA-processing protein DprA [Bacillota bacterium]
MRKAWEIRTASPGDRAYPPLLAQIKKPPPVLYYIGDLEEACRGPCLAVVGARKGTAYGRWAAGRIAERAAACGVTIVSGMAYGVDAAAHQGALRAPGGKTVAVLGCGVDIPYPEAHRELMGRIAAAGAVISELPPGTEPRKSYFPARNRIISGISKGVLVAEAGLRSGSLITAGTAAEQGRDIFAVPGNINNVYSLGANKLIQDGAVPIVVIDDILDCLGIPRPLDRAAEEALGKDEALVYRAVAGGSERSVEEIARETGKSPAEIGALVTILEMKGWVQTAVGKIFVAK